MEDLEARLSALSIVVSTMVLPGCGARTPLGTSDVQTNPEGRADGGRRQGTTDGRADAGGARPTDGGIADAGGEPRASLVLFGGIDVSNHVFDETWIFDRTKAWVRAAPSLSPPARRGAVAAPVNGKVLLFGGVGSSAVLTDTWLWDGTTWSEQHPTRSPPPRSDEVAATLNGTVVLLYSTGCWSWDGTEWTELHPSTLPSPRTSSAMALGDGSLILFGGENRLFLPVGSTWRWDGRTWAEEHPMTAPSPRRSSAAATLNGTVVLFGGDTLPDPNGGWVSTADTWVWDGSVWLEHHPARSPGARAGAAAASLGGEVVLFGGRNFQSRFGASDTWAWDGTTWTEQKGSGPSERSGATMSPQ